MYRRFIWNTDIRAQSVNASMHVDLSRFESQYERAQMWMDTNCMRYMVPYMPMVTGNFIHNTMLRSAALAGSGYVCAGASPQGMYLYHGKTMVSPTTGSPYAQLGEKKVLVSQYSGMTAVRENLQFDTAAHPKVEPRWFEAMKRDRGADLIAGTKRRAGGR